ncbi:MAG: hypothetical protein E7586_01380 [Ruminococcaceae bacterium]|nr:hypothetical protein [Oscillospiraceae bacterium]
MLLLALVLGLSSCNKGEEDSLDESSEAQTESSSEQSAFTVKQAEQLLEQDKLLTEIFICNYLRDVTSVKAERTLVSADNKYADFSEIEKLIGNTYLQDSGDKEFFMSYPENQEPSVVSQDGKTSVFCHIGSNYNDYADYSTLSVLDTDDEKVKELSFSTLLGKELTVKAFLQEDGKWLLEKGIYRLNPPQTDYTESPWGKTNVGSLKNLSGKTLVIKLFVSDKDTEITPADETFFHQRIESALQSLTQDLSQFGITPDFEYESTYFEHKKTLGNRAIDFDMMLAQTTFGTLENFARDNTDLDLSKYDNYFFVVCTKNDMELSVGVFDKTEEKDLYFGERILTGASVTDLDIYKSVLCLLGADLRGEDGADKYTEALYKFYFPNDFAVTKDLTTVEISPVTAYMCGFTDKLNFLYKTFLPRK